MSQNEQSTRFFFFAPRSASCLRKHFKDRAAAVDAAEAPFHASKPGLSVRESAHTDLDYGPLRILAW